jgi:hypothetical protein
MARRITPLLLLVPIGYVACCAAIAAPARKPPPVSPEALYGGPIDFQILRNGTPVGTQQVTFEKRGDLVAETESTDIKISLLVIPVFHFHYDCSSLWRGGALVGLNAATDDNGKRTAVTAKLAGDQLVIDGPAGQIDAPPALLPADHWNVAVLRQTELLNSINGKIDKVRITDEGPDSVPAPEGRRAAHRYVYHGDLKLTAWYDSAGHWVGLGFTADDGSHITYVCERCGPPPG